MTKIQKIQIEVEELLNEKEQELEDIPFDKNSEEYFEVSEALSEKIAILGDILDKLDEIGE